MKEIFYFSLSFSILYFILLVWLLLKNSKKSNIKIASLLFNTFMILFLIKIYLKKMSILYIVLGVPLIYTLNIFLQLMSGIILIPILRIKKSNLMKRN